MCRGIISSRKTDHLNSVNPRARWSRAGKCKKKTSAPAALITARRAARLSVVPFSPGLICHAVSVKNYPFKRPALMEDRLIGSS